MSPAPARSQSPLRVSIRHGGIEYVDKPAVIGHIQGTPLGGAEKRIDEISRGELTQRRILRRYVGQIGEVVILDDLDLLPTVAVVGLGATGELTSARLTQTLVPAFIDLARGHLAEHRDDPAPLSLAVIPIGTSYAGGLTVEASIRAVLSAVREAEVTIGETVGSSRQGRGAPFEFEGIEFVDCYADKVEILASVLQRLAAEAEDHPDEQIETEYILSPVVGEGAAAGAPPRDREEVWRRLHVERSPSEDGSTVFSYTVAGRLARAESLDRKVDDAVIEPMLKRSTRSIEGPDVARALYEVLVPPDLKGELATGESLHLLLDENTAHLPWELLTPRSSGYQASVPLSMRGGMLRQFADREARPGQPDRASTASVLVIGNPPSDPSRYPPLPGAADEATIVTMMFDDAGWTVRPYIWDAAGARVTQRGWEVDETEDPSWLSSTLVTDEWRVVHIAGHGTVGETDASSGIVLAPDQLLTPSVFASLSIVPDLVFVNACHLGSIGVSLATAGRVSASVARTLLRIGVRAVVVAGWAVDDKAAQSFASRLYELMLSRGETFGRAVHEARRAAHAAAPTSPTWAAYQCYGDPGFRLANPVTSSRSWVPITETALLREIDWLIGAAKDIDRFGTHTLEELESDLDRLCPDGYREPPATTSAAPEPRLGSDVLARLADAYTAVGRPDRGATLYEWALRQERALAPVRSVEKLADLLTRSAVVDGKADPERFAAAHDLLTVALRLGETSARLSLLGRHFVQRALAEPEARAERLGDAVEAFGRAAGLRVEGSVVAEALRYAAVHRLSDGPELDPALIEAFEEVRAEAVTGSGFAAQVARADVQLTAALVAAAQPETVPKGWEPTEAVETYLSAFAAHSTARERRAVTEQLRDLATLCTRRSVATALVEAAERLESWKPGASSSR